MKFRYVVGVQALALIAAVVAGFLLNNSIAEGPRDLHRFSGMLAELASIAVVVMALIQGKSAKTKMLALGALVFVIVAGLAGKSLSNSTNYDVLFNVMRASAVVALVLSVMILAQPHDKTKIVKEAKTDESED